MSTILHISYDFGDPKDAGITNAVSNLVNETKKIASAAILDLSRVNSFNKEMVMPAGENHLKIKTFGLPYGLLHKYHLKRVFKKFREAENAGFIDTGKIKLIHSHKLTFDGFPGYLLSAERNIPLIITLRQTDIMVLKYRPDLRNDYENILKHCTKIIYLIPSMLPMLKNILGTGFYKTFVEKKLVYIPNIISAPSGFENNNVKEDAPLITILRLTKRSAARKNLKSLFKAVSELKDIGFRLDVIGGGEYLPEVKKWTMKYRIGDKVSFKGHVENSEIRKYYAGAKAFILPSFSESFGLVYAESLLNGTPILYSRGVLGFDGVFENVGCPVNPYSVDSIKEGIRNIINNNHLYRSQIKKLKEDGAFRIFSADFARKQYRMLYEEITGGKSFNSEKIKQGETVS